MKIYLAGPCSKDERTHMKVIASALRKKSYEVYCPFELKIPNAWDYSQEEWSKMVFDKDIAAIDECDFMILMSKGRNSTAGTNWEQGYAYAKGKDIFVFQYTKEETSLMTYCGCKYFANLPFFDKSAELIANFPYNEFRKEERGLNPCKTILT